MATGIDFLIFSCLIALSILAASYLHIYPSSEKIWLLTALFLIGWTWLEANNRRTLGKQAAGLMLELPGNLFQRWLRLLVRNLAKGSLIYGDLFLGSQFQVLPRHFSSQLTSWESLALPILIWAALILCLRMFGTDRQPQDWLSGSRVVSEPQPLTLWQQSFNFLGVSLTGFIILFLSLTQPVSSRHGGGGKNSSVKANMHTLQTMVETYAVDWGGVYPANLSALKYEATRHDREYWKDFTNPFTGKSGANLSYDDQAPIEKANPAQAGQVIYAPVTSCGPIVRYYIYGLGKDGGRLQDKGHDLTLSNS